MGSMVIVIFQPFLGDFPELIKIFKDVGVQYILTESAIESLDKGPWLGIPGGPSCSSMVSLRIGYARIVYPGQPCGSPALKRAH